MAEAEKKPDAATEKAEEKSLSKRTTQLIALTALVLAICATFSSLKSGANANKGILEQNMATNGWSYYQAKSLKQNIYQVQLDRLEIDPPAGDPARIAELRQKYQETVDRYEGEMQEIMGETRAHEAKRDAHLALNAGFAGAVTYLQIAILLVSLAALVKQIYFWYIGIAVGAVGVFQFLSTLLAA